MIRFVLVLLLAITVDPVEVAKINSLKKKAEYHYQKGNYNEAIKFYSTLIDSMGVEEDRIALNLAHAYVQMNDTANARTYYSKASMSDDKSTKSIAYQQLGVLAKKPESLNESLQYLKSSLKADPTNVDARYDYEVVKKLLEKQKEEQEKNKDDKKDDKDQDKKDQQDQQNQQNQDQQQKGENEEQQQDQQQKDQQQQDQDKDKKGEEQKDQQQKDGEQNKDQKEQQKSEAQKKLEEMNISEEKAKMILEAMRNAEIQYLQQQKRKASERPDTGKPDW
jgi:hypothetical protein